MDYRTVLGILDRRDSKELSDLFNTFERIDYNVEMRASRTSSIEKAMPFCGGSFRKLSELAKIPECTVKKYVWDVRNAHLKKLMDKLRAMNKGKNKSDFNELVKEAIIACNGNKQLIAAYINRSAAYTGIILNSLHTPEIRELYYKTLEDIKRRNLEEKNLNSGKTDSRDEFKLENHNPDFEIDSMREHFLPHQIEFAYMKPDMVKHPALIGGFGSGKTMSIPLRWLKLIEFRMAQGKKCDLMVLEPTNEMVRDIIIPTFDEFFERFSIPTKYLSVKQNYSIYYKGEKHTCLLRSADRPRSLTGKNLSDIIIDEFDRIPYYKQKQVWRECISRIRKTEFGTCAVVTTPDGYKMTYELWGKQE